MAANSSQVPAYLALAVAVCLLVGSSARVGSAQRRESLDCEQPYTEEELLMFSRDKDPLKRKQTKLTSEGNHYGQLGNLDRAIDLPPSYRSG